MRQTHGFASGALAWMGPGSASGGHAQESADDRDSQFLPVKDSTGMANGSVLLVEAYGLIWLILLAFVFLSWRRQSRIDARVSELERALAAARKEAP